MRETATPGENGGATWRFGKSLETGNIIARTENRILAQVIETPALSSCRQDSILKRGGARDAPRFEMREKRPKLLEYKVN